MSDTMQLTTFAALPPGSRVWAFAADHDLSDAELARLETEIARFFEIWKHKAELIGGCYEVRERRFLLVGADESQAKLSGCSIDAMMARLIKLGQDSGLTLVDRARITYRDRAGKVQSCDRPTFRQRVASGEVDERTPVFDTTIAHVEALREDRFEVPMGECWHSQLFRPATTVGSERAT